MKISILIILMTILCMGCTSIQHTPNSFNQAVLASIDPMDKDNQIVLILDENASITVSKRSISLDDLYRICNVSNLPENPPAILIRCNRKARHVDVRPVLDTLKKAGMLRVKFTALREEKLQNKIN